VSPAAALILTTPLDLFALDTRDFGADDPQQPDPVEWIEE
jgi:hypothetical protein